MTMLDHAIPSEIANLKACIYEALNSRPPGDVTGLILYGGDLTLEQRFDIALDIIDVQSDLLRSFEVILDHTELSLSEWAEDWGIARNEAAVDDLNTRFAELAD